jgi:hypothetical protein
MLTTSGLRSSDREREGVGKNESLSLALELELGLKLSRVASNELRLSTAVSPSVALTSVSERKVRNDLAGLSSFRVLPDERRREENPKEVVRALVCCGLDGDGDLERALLACEGERERRRVGEAENGEEGEEGLLEAGAGRSLDVDARRRILDPRRLRVANAFLTFPPDPVLLLLAALPGVVGGVGSGEYEGMFVLDIVVVMMVVVVVMLVVVDGQETKKVRVVG